MRPIRSTGPTRPAFLLRCIKAIWNMRVCSFVFGGITVMRSLTISLVALFLAVPSAARPDSVEPVPPSDSRVNDEVSQRATLLADGLADAPRMHRAVKTIQVVSIVLGGAAVALSVPFVLTADSRIRPYAAAVGGSAFALLGGGVLSYAVPDDFAFGVLNTASDVSMGTFDLALGLAADDTAPQRQVFAPAVGYMLAAGEWGQAGLRVLDMALRRPIAYGTLAADYRRLYSPRYRASMSAEDLAAVEARFERQGA